MAPAAVSSKSPSPPQWVLDLHAPPKPKTKANIPDPPGYSASTTSKVRTLVSISLQTSNLPYASYSLTRSLSAALLLGQVASAKASHPGRNRHVKDQEIVGTGAGARQGAPHERHHDVHVGKLAANLQHHDGLHALQESDPGLTADQLRLREVRDRGHAQNALDGQGHVHRHEPGRFELGDLEGQRDGLVTVSLSGSDGSKNQPEVPDKT